MMLFAVLEVLPFYKRLEFSESKLPLGGVLSGFFGGLSGHQGALRSAFLVRCGLTKDVFIASGIVIACLVDVSRISVYASRMQEVSWGDSWPLLLTAVLCAFTGAYFGRKLLKKVTISFVHNVVTIMIMIMAVVLGFGII